ncbi:hypothetical protein [Natronosalvus rutilus]|uniref:Twin-arginine translocation signal domain-containing protein n=1 Tax=Natronosalvus rutilus TaxID=2953753 RepID=A0A9E7NFT0_9EURY|nr:hypothetical protein [Natronosalvus rutilus]UTF56028.1 hypothetical protein NGM29_20795 [Natronosalvus rutilus]
MERRNFLRKTAAVSTLAGAGLIGTTGNATASKSPYDLDVNLHTKYVDAGDTSHDSSATFRVMIPESHLGDYTPFDEFIDAEADHCQKVISDLVSKSNYLMGATAYFYEYDGGWFEDYDGHTGWGDNSYAIYEPTLDVLDDALNTTSLGDNVTYVWDVGDVHQNQMSDWEGSGSDEHHDGPRTDPAMSSSRWHPIIADKVAGDQHSNDYAHARVRIADYCVGRLTSMLVHTLIRCRDDGHWQTVNTPPGTDIYDTDRDWELAEGIHNGNDNYVTSAGGKKTLTAMEDVFASSFCRGDSPSGDWSPDSGPLGDYVSYCTSDMVSQAVSYFETRH